MKEKIMYLSIPRPTMQELNETLCTLDDICSEFGSYLSSHKLSHLETFVQMTAHLRRNVNQSRGALVPRELVLKLSQAGPSAGVDALTLTQHHLDIFIERSIAARHMNVRQIRDDHLLNHPLVVFNKIFYGGPIVTSDDLSAVRLYEDFILAYYEAQCDRALVRMRAMMKKENIDPYCFTLEIDLYDTAGPGGNECTATYNVIQHGNLSQRKRRRVEAIIVEVALPLQGYFNLLARFNDQLLATAGGQNA